MIDVKSREDFTRFAEELAAEHRLFHPEDAREVVPEMFSVGETVQVFENLQWAYQHNIDPCKVFLRALNAAYDEVRTSDILCPVCDAQPPLQISLVEADGGDVSFVATCLVCGVTYDGSLEKQR